MQYRNPVLRGFYPDPSVCFARGKYYLVCSSFQYFPAVPLFESDDLVNWRQLGHVLTRPSQVALAGVPSSGGVFAPTIRFDNGRFYMVTTNNSTGENFYVFTDDITGPWSEPVYVEQSGIDPSLTFEHGRAYFMSNGTDEAGPGIFQCEIDPATGRKRSETRCLWRGSGGRYLEGPHLYHIGPYYYLLAAEGGTEYGHMVTCARSPSLWGPYEGFPANPLLSNRDCVDTPIQGIGHGELIQDRAGEWHVLSLGFRQIGRWLPYHHLGREVFLTPARLGEDGWFSAGDGGHTLERYETAGEGIQILRTEDSFENTLWGLDWLYLRHPHPERYSLSPGRAVLLGSNATLSDGGSPTFLGIRQREFWGRARCHFSLDSGEGGLVVYMSEDFHYALALRRLGGCWEALLRLNVGGIRHVEGRIPMPEGEGDVEIDFSPERYRFFVRQGETAVLLGAAPTLLLSSEVAGGFTGVLLGLYATGDNRAEFTRFRCTYQTESSQSGGNHHEV
ncbi:MAG: glycoside hydrolase family 43 protein [Clostridiales bacterium]|nr:glycoside hydrolase family 43 protein [Clostridiales bacterium]